MGIQEIQDILKQYDINTWAKQMPQFPYVSWILEFR